MKPVSVFISHSSRNKDQAREIAQDLKTRGFDVWLDEWMIKVGDSIAQEIQHGLDRTDFIVVLLTGESIDSGWVEKEWQAKIGDEANKRKILVLTLLLEDCNIPILLKDKKYADFRENYQSGMTELVDALNTHSNAQGITFDYAIEPGSHGYRNEQNGINIQTVEEKLETLPQRRTWWLTWATLACIFFIVLILLASKGRDAEQTTIRKLKGVRGVTSESQRSMNTEPMVRSTPRTTEEEKYSEAWSILRTSTGKPGNLGRGHAIRILAEGGQRIERIDFTNASFVKINQINR